MPRKPSLPRLLKQCQGLLGLGDWRITAKYASLETIRRELKEAGNGCLSYDADHKTAVILLLDPTKAPHFPGELAKESVRFWMLHELLHLHTFRLVGDAINQDEEQVVNTLARAFDSLM
jgi:hypothetical protein